MSDFNPEKDLEVIVSMVIEVDGIKKVSELKIYNEDYIELMEDVVDWHIQKMAECIRLGGVVLESKFYSPRTKANARFKGVKHESD